MPIIERDVVLTGRDELGQTTMDLPVTRLGLVEGDAEVKGTPAAGDYLPVLDGQKMKKVSFEALQKAINDGQSDASASGSGLLSAEDKKKLDGITAEATKNAPSSTAPKALGTAFAGSEAGYARGDHVHPKPSPADLGAAAANHTHTALELGFRIFSAGTTAPADKTLLWIDTTATTGGLKYYNGTAWVHVPVATT